MTKPFGMAVTLGDAPPPRQRVPAGHLCHADAPYQSVGAREERCR